MNSSDINICLKKRKVFAIWTIMVFTGKSFIVNEAYLDNISYIGMFLMLTGFLMVLIININFFKRRVKSYANIPFISIIADILIGFGRSLKITNIFLIGSMIALVILVIQRFKLSKNTG